MRHYFCEKNWTNPTIAISKIYYYGHDRDNCEKIGILEFQFDVLACRPIMWNFLGEMQRNCISPYAIVMCVCVSVCVCMCACECVCVCRVCVPPENVLR